MTTSEPYGTLPCGRTAHLFTLTNRHGVRVRVSDFGALLISVETPDRNGRTAEITLGYDHLNQWIADTYYLGATVGRFGNRIANGRFTLDGKSYQLATNNAPAGIPCHLHGGIQGFNKVLWDHEILPDGVRLTYLSRDGEEGYPGNLTAVVTFTLNEDNELTWLAEATTDAATPVNLVNHTYWNLSGSSANTILDHELTVHATHFLASTPGLIPTGESTPVANTPVDFTTPHTIGERIDAPFPALVQSAGYDQCFVLADTPGLRPAGHIHHPATGRTLDVLTDQPGMHVYAGNFLDGAPGRGGQPLIRRSGLCMETERFPDAPNQPAFPSSILRPGETYRHTQVLRFGTAS